MRNKLNITEERLSEIVREAIMNEIDGSEADAKEFFDSINSRHALTQWGKEGREQRFKPGNAARAMKPNVARDFKVHSYKDWERNYKPLGIPYEDYWKKDA